MQDSESQLDSIFLSYDKILDRFRKLNITTKNNKEITHKDLRYAIDVMVKKHPTCRWKSQKIRNKKYLILIEGYQWLVFVYFQKDKNLIDADIGFFETKIKQYEELLKVHPKNLFTDNLSTEKLEEYFCRAKPTIKKSIYKMLKYNTSYRYFYNGKYIITKEGIEWLCKNCFKQKYLEVLEKYKMELTELYIQAGYPYDNYFQKN